MDKSKVGIIRVCFIVLFVAIPSTAQQITSYSLITEASQLTKGDIRRVRKRAEAGDVHSQLILGTAYKYGFTVQQNYVVAAREFSQAAQAGDQVGETLLARMYQWGPGVNPNQAEAFSWFRRAADHGSAEAQFELAKAYAHGWGVPMDEGQSEALYRMAADNGFSPAKCILESQSPDYAHPHGTGIKPPHAIYTPDPEYSEAARKAKLSGTVELWVGVGADGLVHETCVSQPLGLGLEEKSVEAVRQWKFDPATRNGQPVAAGLTVSTTFRLY